jgi:hypothetical protein
LLGYEAEDANLKSLINKYSTQQILNHIFKADTYDSDTIFTMEKFAHRPIFCGVNVIYDPSAAEEFSSMRHLSDYFNDSWKNEYNNKEYLADPETGEYEYRDITFSPKFLEDLQRSADKNNELISLFIRNGFSVGLSSVNYKYLGKNSALPAQYSRVFISNKKKDPAYDYTTVLMRSNTLRLDPSKTPDDPGAYTRMPNYNVLIDVPALKDDKGKETQKAEKGSENIKHPCIIFAGESLANVNAKEGEPKGYELATYTAVPICSWEYFANGDSGFRGSKAVERLSATNNCGPFTRVIAKGFYSTAISSILQTYTEIDLTRIKKDKDSDEYVFAIKQSDGTFDWESVDEDLRKAAMAEYSMLESSDIKSDKGAYNDIELYESAYYRDADHSQNPHIKKLFDKTVLPRRFAFFRTKSNKDTIHIRQYPAIPILNPLPMQDDYITQLVPVYRNLDDNPSEEDGVKWYINPNDILVKGINGTFYNVCQQTYEKAEYPNAPNQGVMFTYTGHLYTGPVEGTSLPKHVTAIKMSAEIDPALAFKTNPITIAPNNTLEYMIGQAESNAARNSRKAYIEFIKQGCVWKDVDDNEPEKENEKIIPESEPIGIELSKYAEVEHIPSVTPTNASAEANSATNKTSLYIAIAVLVAVICFILIFIIYRSIKKKKAALMGITQGFFCGESVSA